MKVLLRSTFSVNNEPSNALVNNFRLLDGSGLGFDDPADNAIWDFVKNFIQQHHHAPEIGTIKAHFDRTNQVQVSDRLEEVAIAKPKLSSGDFEFYLNSKVEDRKKKLVASYLQEASEILAKGVEIKNKDGEKQILVGPHAAIEFLMDKSHDILTPVTGSKISGEVTSDAQDFLEEYQRVKLDPLAGIGQFTGLQPIDTALSGAKRNELWVHAAFTGHMKTTTMLNWAYNQAVHYGYDSLMFSLEMPYHQVRRILYAMHSRHSKFKYVHAPLDYGKIRDGLLAPDEEDFLATVAHDFNNSGYGKIFIEVFDPNKLDFTVSDLKHRAETIYARTPFRLLFVDHGGLVSAKKWVPSTTERLNEVIRDLKKVAMTFNKGMGMAVVMLFQMSREAYKGGRKARGLDGGNQGARSNHVYNLTGSSYPSEAERSADIVTTTWVDEELQANNQVLYQCLKSRDNAPFEPFCAGVHWPTRSIYNLDYSSLQQVNAIAKEIELDTENL